MKPNKNEKTAEIVGMSLGDGSLTIRNDKKNKGLLRFQMRGHVEERIYYDQYVKSLFDKHIGVVQITHYKGKNASYGICSEKNEVCRNLHYLGIPIGVKKELQIPSWIKQNTHHLRGFIRGFFDTDGSVFCGKDYNYPEKKHIKIRMSGVSISFQFIKEISQSLSHLGVHNLVIKPYKKNDPRFGDINKIQIDGPNVVNYFKIIGSHNPKHITKYQVWTKFGFCPPHTTLKQRDMILEGKIDPTFYYEKNNKQNAGVAEPGQMRKSTVKNNMERLVEETSQKPCPLVGARVRITSPAS